MQHLLKKGLFGFFIITLVTLTTVLNGFFVVNPTELAGVRRLGQVITTEPLGPGLHLKAPWIDTVDTLQVSLDTFKVTNLIVYTIDNQAVTISVSMSYRIPKTAVFKLLYEVGRAGSFDIADNIQPVLSDRIMRIFAKTNTTKISEQREQIAVEIRTSIRQSLGELFGIEVADLQISAIGYSKTFEASVEAAVKAKNDAIAAENTVRRIQYEGEQKVVTAKAEAEALMAKSEADKKARILAAEGEAQAIELEGAAQAKSLRWQAEAAKNSPELIELIKAQRWSGDLPKTMLGNTIPFLNLNDLQTPSSQSSSQSMRR